MTGDISRAIALTTCGTAYLKNDYDISCLTLAHPVFTFTNKVEFQYFKKHFFRKSAWQVYAVSPIDWLQKLKKAGCIEIRFVFQSDNHVTLNGENVPDHQLAGFVGGGGQRYIQAVFKNHSDYWQSREEVTDKDALDSRIWTITYGRTLTAQPTPTYTLYDIEAIKQKLKDKLTTISLFAKNVSQTYWAERFDKALDLLDSVTLDKSQLHVPTDKMKYNILQLLAGSRQAWVFGGMGSWNDIIFQDKDEEATYDKLSKELYDVLNESYLAVANSYH